MRVINTGRSQLQIIFGKYDYEHLCRSRNRHRWNHDDDGYFTGYLLDSGKEENQEKILQKMFPKADFNDIIYIVK